MKKLLSFLLGGFLFFANSAFGLTVEDAYKAIPHEQVPFTSSKSSLQTEERLFLTELFRLSDTALVARIEALQQFSKGSFDALPAYEAAADGVLSELSKLSGPKSATGLASLLTRAVQSQRDFLREWAKNGSKYVQNGYRSNPHVLRSSALLQQLYSELMLRYAKESEHNRRAFFQHLCALDFI